MSEKAIARSPVMTRAQPSRRRPRPPKGSRHRAAVDVLRQMIQLGELPPGTRPGEVAISLQLGMSRTPVREAFRTLVAEGLLELLPSGRVKVPEFEESEAVDVFAVLGALEALAGQLACLRMTADQLQTLRDLQAEMEVHFANLDRAEYIRTNRAIHELMVMASGNAPLAVVWRMTAPRAERARALLTYNRGHWVNAVEAHRQIVAALADRDGVRLSALMHDHFARGVIDRISRSGRPPGSEGAGSEPKAGSEDTPDDASG
jgi:DNA-binding GntR family transcriptional regulator